MVHGDGDDRTVTFGGHFKAALVKGEKIQFIPFISGPLGKNTDGDPGFYIFNGFQDGLQTLLDILAVQKKTV